MMAPSVMTSSVAAPTKVAPTIPIISSGWIEITVEWIALPIIRVIPVIIIWVTEISVSYILNTTNQYQGNHQYASYQKLLIHNVPPMGLTTFSFLFNF